MTLYEDAQAIIAAALRSAQPDSAVESALDKIDFGGRRVHLVAIGKAAWQMAAAAYNSGRAPIRDGIVITKYGHAQGPLGPLEIFEAGHPVSDENTYAATDRIIELARGLGAEDAVLFLVSGGGSALFEKPVIPAQDYEGVTGQLLACGADIVEINTVRKRLSAVKGGKFADICAPARVYSVILSDVLGDPIDAIASGPAYPDSSRCGTAWAIAEKYGLTLSAAASAALNTETPKSLDNVETLVTGSVRELCRAAAEACQELGYAPTVLTDRLCCQAREAGSFLASIGRTYADCGSPRAYIAGGETVVRLTGSGKGGRNQELALAAAEGIAGLRNVAVFSVGSDGTDGPTDAAGGYVDGDTAGRLLENGLKIYDVLRENDSYNALRLTDGLIITGPTGTNVNDVSVLLIS